MADSTSDGGFTPLMLSPIDFASLYQQRMAQVQAQAEAEANGKGSSDNA
jgi:preprotein translocase subunit SecB